jgi:hypothetical protein
MNVAIDAGERRALLRTTAVGTVIALAFAAPATIKLLQGRLGPNESRLGEALADAFGGITLPIVAAAIAASVLGGALRGRVDRLVAAGGEPQKLIARPLAFAVLSAVLASALAGAITVLLLRSALKLGGGSLIVTDIGATAWANALGAAAWTAVAAAFVTRSGRPVRAWIVVPFDLLTRLLPGAASWFAPSAHVDNVLGAPPPRGFVHVPVLSQWISVALLIAMTATAIAIAVRRYAGTPAR